MERRRATRHTVEWAARYRLHALADWRRCRLIDVGKTGATIEPFDLLDHESPSGSEIAIQFELLAEPPEKFELHGAVRHRTRTADGRIRLGIELENLTSRDVILLDLISRRLDSFI